MVTRQVGFLSHLDFQDLSLSQVIARKAYCHSQLQLADGFAEPQGMTPVVCVSFVVSAQAL